MNKTYRLIWNEFTRTWVAVGEIAKARGKRASGVVLLAAAGAALAAPPVSSVAPGPNQLPTGGLVVAGNAGIAQNGALMNINQSSQRAAINWQTFNVGSAAQVNFNQQQGASSVTLNRVFDSNPSQIFGRITAPGQVFFTNPNGIYFAPGASVDVGGLVATTHTIGNADFMAGNDLFTRNRSTGSVINDGNLSASLGGYIALLAPEVRNNGVIVAQLGTVALAAGETYQLQFGANNTLANILVTPATIKALVENGNAVQAPGGLIILSAQAVDRLQGGVVNNSGALEATGLVSDGGRIVLAASDSISHTGTINVDAAPGRVGVGGTATLITDLTNHEGVTDINGSISARGGDLGGNGGFVETSGGRVKIGSNTRVDTRAPQGKTGTWLLDPDGFTIAASGGDISGATLSANLLTADVSIASTSGAGSDDNVNVNDTVAWNANKLTLTATNDVNINAVMVSSGSAVLDLEPGGSGKVNIGFDTGGTFKGRVDFVGRSGAGILTIGGNGYYLINSLGAAADATSGSNQTLQGMARNANLANNFALSSDINASDTSTWNSVGGGVYAGFRPIGSSGPGLFTGTFDGLGHTISNLTINRPNVTNVGLFGGISGTIRNIALTSATVTGNNS